MSTPDVDAFLREKYPLIYAEIQEDASALVKKLMGKNLIRPMDAFSVRVTDVHEDGKFTVSILPTEGES